MSSAGQTPAPLRPSVFLSYSSDDRAAARLLRDALAAGGLEVWYDENELGGGDAWDQKIRRQIRDCDYFMPVISASTERRKEGYFRREWRLASERTMDMADDVLFLLPVVIDGTSESGARVPDKFVSVQWLRAPGGQPTPAFDALIKRLLAGEHTAPARPPLIGRTAAVPPPARATPPVAPSSPPPSGPPPMPPFPHHPPHSGHWARYVAEVLWWIITAGWLLFSRLPRWIRIIVTIWAIITLFGMCKTTTTPKKTPKPDAADAPAAAAANDEVKNAIRSVGEAIQNASKDGKEPDFGKIGVEMARRFATGKANEATAAKTLIVVPFALAGVEAADKEFSQAVFSATYGNLMISRPTGTSLSTATVSGTDDTLTRVGREAGARFVLGARVAVNADGARTLVVRLTRTEDGLVAWSGDYPFAAADATKVGSTIAEAVIAALPPATKK